VLKAFPLFFKSLLEIRMSGLPVKILGICGSHRKEKNTYYALKRGMDALSRLGIPVETEIISLADMRIEDCLGCHLCFTKAWGDRFCPSIRDDMDNVYPKLIEADGILVASPVHWWSASSKLRRFIDRSNAFCGSSNCEHGGALYNKVGGVITVAYNVHGGTEVAASNIVTWMLTVNMIVVGTQSAHIGGTAATNLGSPPSGPDSVKFDHHGMKTVYEVVKRVAETAWLIKAGRGCLPAGDGSNGQESPRNRHGIQIDWDKFFQYENSFPVEHVGVERKLATSGAAFEYFVRVMAERSKSEGGTWGKISNPGEFRQNWLRKLSIQLVSDDELYFCCPEYYDFFLKN
jgi:multimeric flavodoxin WrbA